jgi:hypothetical protein
VKENLLKVINRDLPPFLGVFSFPELKVSCFLSYII